MIETLRPLIARLIGALVAAGSAYLIHHFNFALGTDAETGLQSFILLAVYAAVHKYLAPTAPTTVVNLPNNPNTL